jgi:hypothetical protein
MRGWTGAVLAFAGLALFEGVVSSTSATGRLGGFLARAGEAVHWFVSPAVPFFKTAPVAHGAAGHANPAAGATAPQPQISKPATTFQATPSTSVAPTRGALTTGNRGR